MRKFSLKNICNTRELFFFFFSLFVSLSVLMYLFSIISWSDLFKMISNVSGGGLLLYIFFSFSMSFFRTWRYALLLQIAGYQTNLIGLFLITLVRNLFSDLLPARMGTLVYIYLARHKLGVSWSSASASFAYSFIFDILSLGFLLLGAAFVITTSTVNPLMIIFGGFILVTGSYGALFMLPWMTLSVSRLLPWVFFINESWRHRIDEGLKFFRNDLFLLQRSNQQFRVLLLSFAIRCCKYLALYILLLSLVFSYGYTELDFPLVKVVLAICSAEMAASLPVSGLAGFGAYEGTWSLVFQFLGYSKSISVLTGVSHHLLTQVYGYSLGVLALLALLLPWWKQVKVLNMEKIFMSSRAFNPLFFMFFLLPLALVVFHFSEIRMLQRSMKAAVLTPSPQVGYGYNQGPAPGWVVYQRSDGIYKEKIENGGAVLLRSKGRYPRWSPDGKLIAYVDGNRIMIMDNDAKRNRQIAISEKGRAVCFHPNGKSILYTSKNKIFQVKIDSGETLELVQGNEFFELDISNDGRTLVATEKSILGYRVVEVNLNSGVKKIIGRGCSASISADGEYISVNGREHKILYLHSRLQKDVIVEMEMVQGLTFDNQFWSNDPNWLVSKSDGISSDIYVHHFPSQKTYQITFSGDIDRPDYFVKPTAKDSAATLRK